jgi:glycogen synthase
VWWLILVILATWEVGRSGGLLFKAGLGKKVRKIPSQQKKLGVVGHTCNPSYTGSINKRTTVQASLYKKQTPISKITKAKIGWGHGSSGREPA